MWLDMVFFAKDRKSAWKRVMTLRENDTYYRNKVPSLAKKQVHHTKGWKTWKLTKVI